MDAFLDLMQLVASNVWSYGVTFLIVLSLLVFVHEWGHYIVARLCGVRVETFSIGFGKELFGWTSKAGTRWKFAMIPLGGYVKMFGDIDPASAGHAEGVADGEGQVRPYSVQERDVAFFAKPVWKRSLIVFAGPAINFIFAILLLTVLYVSVGKPITPPLASGVEIGGAADAAGFKPHDQIVSINGKPVVSFDEVRRHVMLALDTPMDFAILRDGRQMNLVATPKKVEEEDRFGFTHQKGYLGLIGPANAIDITKIVRIDGVDVEGNPDKSRKMILAKLGQPIVVRLDRTGIDAADMAVNPPRDMNKHLTDPSSKDYNTLLVGVKAGNSLIKYNIYTGFKEAVIETGDIVVDTLKALWQMVTGTRSASELGGIIRIGALAGDMAAIGLVALATFTALLSINLGLINLFPIPMLDGGHLLFYAIEAIKGGPLSEKVQEYAFRFGMFVLIALMFFANLNDIMHLIL